MKKIIRPTTKDKTERKFYLAWTAMLGRCKGLVPNTKKNYKDRGIVVCERWQDFNNFYADMWNSFLIHNSMYGGRQTQLDRINNDKGYHKANCHWVTPEENCRNRQNNIKIKGKTLAAWAKELNVTPEALSYRNKLGYSLDKMLHKGNLPSDRAMKIQGKTYEEWSKETGVNVDTLRKRINKLKWPLDKALSLSLIKPDDLRPWRKKTLTTPLKSG